MKLKKVSIDKENTTVVSGRGAKENIEARVAQIKKNTSKPVLLITTKKKNYRNVWPNWLAE